MKSFSRIMVAIDFSDYSLSSLEYAARMARALDSELILANVLNQRDIDAVTSVEIVYPHLSTVQYIKDQTAERTRKIEELVQAAGASDLRWRMVIQPGIPFLTLIRIVLDEDVDLVVMGTKGRSNLADVIVGSTAQKMFRRCPVPLLSIRPAKS